jgi:hypothetical protein
MYLSSSRKCQTLYVSLFSPYVPHAIYISLPPVCTTRFTYLSSPRMCHSLSPSHHLSFNKHK